MAPPTELDIQELPRPFVPPQLVECDFPVIDTDPHIKRVFKYARRSDYAWGLFASTWAPGILMLQEQFAPSYVGKGGFAPVLRLNVAVGLAGGFMIFYTTSIQRLYGWTENAREVQMDMREMVDKVKAGEPLYGHSSLTSYQQHIAARNSRYSALLMHVIPWFNFVNHNVHGVDTAKYYRQAERELEEERLRGEGRGELLGEDGMLREAAEAKSRRDGKELSVMEEVKNLGRGAWEKIREVGNS